MKKKKDRSPISNLLTVEWKYLGKERKIFIIYLILFILANLINLADPLVIGKIFNSIQQNITSNEELSILILNISLLLVITIGFWIFHGIGRYLERRTSFLVKRNYKNSKISKVLDLPIKWHKDHHSGSTIDKINKSSSAISQFSGRMTFTIVRVIISIIGSIVVLMFFDVFAAIFALVFSLGSIIVILKLDKNLGKMYKEINVLENKASASVFDYLSNIITVITLRLKKNVKKVIDRKIMASYEPRKRSMLLSESKWAFASISISVMTVIVLAFRAYTDFHTGGIIFIGTLYILYGYLERIGNTFFSFAGYYGELVEQDARVKNAEIIEEAFKKLKKEPEGKIQTDWKEINLKNIHFSYDEKGRQLHLENVDLKFKKGQKIALIGESGSGKSTILALIRGLYKPKKGSVYCNGERLPKDFLDIRESVTLIPQDPELFNNTVKYNVTAGIPTKQEAVEKVIDIAQFRKVLNRLPKNLETNVLERGVSLSGGEKQRLALARGILAAKKSDIILMDEPTSSVDSINEIKIYENIFKEYKNKTILSSLHKLNLLSKFDYIYLFNKGKIIAKGTLEEMKKNTHFKRFSRKFKI